MIRKRKVYQKGTAENTHRERWGGEGGNGRGKKKISVGCKMSQVREKILDIPLLLSEVNQVVRGFEEIWIRNIYLDLYGIYFGI